MTTTSSRTHAASKPAARSRKHDADRAPTAGGASSDRAAGSPSPWAAATTLIAAAGLLGILYGRSFAELVASWNRDPNYSHGFLVPLLSLGFAAMAWSRIGAPLRRSVSAKSTGLGLAEIVLGLACHAAAQFLGHLFLDVVGLICVLRGTLLVLGGNDVNKAYGFAALFLVFMAPLPMAWYQPIAILMQGWVSGISAQVLDVCGAAVYREGYLIHLPDYTMEVGQACSGLRQLTAVLALSVALGHLSGRSAAYKWTLALLALPIALAANCFRVVLTGVILMWFGPRWAEGAFHTLEGLVVVALAALFMLLTASALAHLEDSLKQKKSAAPARASA
jgi:exosortase